MLHIVIVSYCSWKQLRKTIESFENSEDVEFQLHVVDNLTNEEVKSEIANLSGVTYYPFDNVGYGNGFNQVVHSLKLMSDDLVVLSNDDVILKPDALAQLVHHYKIALARLNKVGPVSPVFLDGNGKENSIYTVGRVSLYESVDIVEFSPGALWLLDYHFLHQVGGFVPDFFIYGEDRELAYRGVYYGYQPICVRTAEVYHDFTYPPTDHALRIEMEKNTIAAQFLNCNQPKTEANWFALKGMLYSLLAFNFKRLRYIRKGYQQFLKSRKKFQKVKNQIQDKGVEFRFIK